MSHSARQLLNSFIFKELLYVIPWKRQEEWDIAPCLWTVTQNFWNLSWCPRLFILHPHSVWVGSFVRAGPRPSILHTPRTRCFPRVSLLSFYCLYHLHNVSLLSWLIFFSTQSHLNWYSPWNHRFVGLYFLYVLKLKSQLLKLMKLIYMPL